MPDPPDDLVKALMALPPDLFEGLRRALSAEKAGAIRFEAAGHQPAPPNRVALPSDWDGYVAAVERWLEEHWTEGTCSRCGSDTWRINEVVALISAPEQYPIAEDSARGFYPAIPVICGQCGHIVLVNATYIFLPR
jgi:hypothetical protein